MTRLFGAVEAGGTKFVCAVGTGPDDLRDVAVIPTTMPGETFLRVAAYFKNHPDRAQLAAIGVASFGPLELDPRSARYGTITSTPKPGWRDADLATPLRRELELPVAFDTDVNGAAMAEWRWGAGEGTGTLLYVTIGTGIGGGLVIGGRPHHGMMHPEMGHMRVPHDREADPFAGVCSFHGDCLEGLASARAIAARWGAGGETLPEDHEAWDLEAEYLALACHNWICAFSPGRIILGGGVMQRIGLLPKIRLRTQELLADYIEAEPLMEGIEHYIVTPALGNRAGVLGGILLAEQALKRG